MVKSALSLRFVNFVNIRVGKPKERECASVRQTVKGVAIADYSFWKIGKLPYFGPGRYQRHSDNVLVELARPFVILYHAGVVMQPLRHLILVNIDRRLVFQICAHPLTLQLLSDSDYANRVIGSPASMPSPSTHRACRSITMS